MKVEDDFAAIRDFVPEGGFPVAGVLILEYIDPDGDTRHAFEALGSQRVVDSLGLFEIGKAIVLSDADDEDPA